jgi:adenylate cyclase class 2
MNPTNQELEVKFWLADLPAVELHLLQLEAQLAHARVLEINFRFDTPEGLLTNRSQVLRLRQDFGVHLTFKGPSRPGEAVSIRKEIEFEASSFLAARDFLEALGYQVMVMYEKYRTEYQFKDVLVMLDEMPYGNFCEIEGADVASIQAAAAELGRAQPGKLPGHFWAVAASWAGSAPSEFLGIYRQDRPPGGFGPKPGGPGMME